MKMIIADREYFNNGIFKESFIPKSLIKEKIDYYKKNYNMVGASSKVSVLEELLKGEEE